MGGGKKSSPNHKYRSIQVTYCHCFHVLSPVCHWLLRVHIMRLHGPKGGYPIVCVRLHGRPKQETIIYCSYTHQLTLVGGILVGENSVESTFNCTC